MSGFLVAALGSGLGGGARHLVSVWMTAHFGPAFPWGTVTVNVVGSFLVAVVMQLSLSTTTISPEMRLLLTTGFMGGFTTYSAFNYETLQFLDDGNWSMGALNVGATLLACLLAAGLGVALVRQAAG